MEEEPVYMIGIAAKLAGVHPQTLRIYERKRLISPKRSGGSTRLYSQRDIDRLKAIQQLTQEMGMNLAGVEKFFELRDEVEALRSVIEELREELTSAREEIASHVNDVPPKYELVPIPRGEIVLRRALFNFLDV